MRAQSARYGCLVYVFHGDAHKLMKDKPDRKWNLYGLWTHSSCPVVQYICEESDRSAESLGLELLGQYLPPSSRHSQAQRRSNHSQWLVVENNGEKLEAELVQRNGLAPVPCSIKELPMESPFTNHATGPARRHRERFPQRRPAEFEPENRVLSDRPNERDLKSSVNKQWYTTSRGEEILRNIHNSCISNFPVPSQVEMSRDEVDHDIQLSIKHNDKMFTVHFPNNFPESSAQVLYDNSIYSSRKLPNEASSKEDIIRIIKNYCRCFRCKNRK